MSKICGRTAPCQSHKGRTVWAYGGHAVGKLFPRPEGLTYVRHVQESRHVFYSLDGWPVGQRIVDQLDREDCAWLEYRSPLGIYRVPFSEFKAKAIARIFPHETQFILPRAVWIFTPPTPSGPAHQAEQGDLFAAVPA